MENPRERERLPRVPGFSEGEVRAIVGASGNQRGEDEGYLLFSFSWSIFHFFLIRKKEKNLLGGDGGHIRFHRPSQIVWRKRKKKTNYNRNSKLKACKIADLETPISTLVQSEGTNQPKENNREKKTKENFAYLYTCWEREKMDAASNSRPASPFPWWIYLACSNFWKKFNRTRKPSDLRRKHSRPQLQLPRKGSQHALYIFGWGNNPKENLILLFI